MEGLPDAVMHLVCRRLGANDVARFSCLSKRCKNVAFDDELWSVLCARDFAVTSRLDFDGNPCLTFKETYDKWRKEFAVYPLSIVKRAKQCWDALKNWAGIHFPELASTLVNGAREEEIIEVENNLGWKLPTTLRVLYRFCNGQHMPEAFSGLLGGYSFYNRMVNVHLLPLLEILKLTKMLCSEISLPGISEYVVIAVSTKLNKFFFINCCDGKLYVGTKNLFVNGEVLPCVPNSLVDVFLQDAILLWLEEYVRNLEAGMFSVQNQHGTRRISLFPEKEPLCSQAVTNGVQVRASAVFVPELTDLQDEEDRYFFSYCIRLCLLHEEIYSTENPLQSCQLSSRHWIIRANGSIIDEVHGEAVIGKFPLLKAGGDVFVYESCSSLPTSHGSIEGDFTFVPGSLSKPEGLAFKAQVAQFPLQIPQYIF